MNKERIESVIGKSMDYENEFEITLMNFQLILSFYQKIASVHGEFSEMKTVMLQDVNRFSINDESIHVFYRLICL